MKFVVHRLDVGEGDAQRSLETFLNGLEGEVTAVLPFTVPSFQGMGGTAKVSFLLVVEKRVA